MTSAAKLDPASARQIDVHGPVEARREIEVAAPVEVVWSVLTDFERWPKWNPAVKSLSLEGGVSEGSTFRWKAGPGKITSTIGRVESLRLIAWTGRTLGIGAVHAWQLERSAAGTVVRTEEAFQGPFARLLRRSLQKTLQSSLENDLQALKAEAERLATGSAGR
jgi:uncharacterized protein YndB with AHSA1/START domain